MRIRTLFRLLWVFVLILMLCTGAWAGDVPLPVEQEQPLPVQVEDPPPPPPTAEQLAIEALAEVNALRASRGLRPFLYHSGLTRGAMGAAVARASRRLFGHLPSDFAYLPPGVSADAAGCAAYPVGYGWLTCCTNEDYTYAGAAYAMGVDGKRYMHLFVSNTGETVGTELYPVAGQIRTVECVDGVCVPIQSSATTSSFSTRVVTTTSASILVDRPIAAAVEARFSLPFMERRGPVRTALRATRALIGGRSAGCN